MDDLIISAREATVSKSGAAAHLWQEIAARRPDDLTTIKEAVAALMSLKATREAEAILRPAVERFSNELDLLMDFARCAAHRGDARDELARWSVIRAQFPDHLSGHIGCVRAARKLGRLAEAEAMVAESLARFPNHSLLLVESAGCAEARWDWAEAIQRWRLVERHGKMDARYYHGLGLALIRTEQVDAAEALLQSGLTKHPGHHDIRVALAEVATAREQWAVAVSIWSDLLNENPGNQRFIEGLGLAKWRYNIQVTTGAEAADEGEAQIVDIGRVFDEAMCEFMFGFESLGEDCEFGMVQRRYGAEPLSMLRWSSVNAGMIIAGLRRGFEGVGEVKNIELDFRKLEIMVTEKSSGMRFHTYIYQNSNLDMNDFVRRQAMHLAFLRRLFLERLREGSKIFVYKPINRVPAEIFEIIYDEIRKYSESPLLVVQRADEQNPPGTLRRGRGDLFFGYLPHFGKDHGPGWAISFDTWVSLCKGVSSSLGLTVPG